MIELLKFYFVQTGFGGVVIGAIVVVTLSCLGSAKGIWIASSQAAGVLSEKPELFGKMLVLMAMPGTQGFYGFICAIIIALRTGIIIGNINVSAAVGVSIFLIAICTGIVEYITAVVQAKAATAAINLTGKQPEEGGRAILIPALVETYAVISLLISILMITWLTKEVGLTFTPPTHILPGI
ncbi:MAG: V-type ATP synthase subunit K [Candidatus Brocadiaceae bacterium]|nr:V-type ATP synthase subunit K [Candidatus Brocadiaceae bacterium]